MPIEKTIFHNGGDNDNIVTLYSLTNGRLMVKIIDYGATIVQIKYPDNNQIERDLVLGFDDIFGYKSKLNPYFGSTIGRFANRIANGTFCLDGQQYHLHRNNGENSLHGGQIGFDKRQWKLSNETDYSITLMYRSFDGEEGYPGTLIIKVRFEITDSDELQIEYEAKLEQQDSTNVDKTIVSLTNHSYFNLNGCYDQNSTKILDHKICLYAQNYLEIDDNLIPTGRILSVKDTVMEFPKQPLRTIGERNFSYDHCYVLINDSNEWDLKTKRPLRLAAEAYSEKTGIKMSFMTDEPAFQFYIGGFISDKGLQTKKSQSSEFLSLGKNSGFCFEAQRFPNAINHDSWRNQVILTANDIYTQKTVYKFNLANV
ncbi:hypothetical protein DERP_007167 [Dermatophagoides pteronyssinus]|uniref:Aldose 1-epimerase n=1 Tax=Dermatophagoides pteronyssinus TaxID=6956 RepID=A0ABQ8JUH9_DERPT|nr:hypothetical protein DERP_007167 [Dermatophagoides pteronyssinus]